MDKVRRNIWWKWYKPVKQDCVEEWQTFENFHTWYTAQGTDGRVTKLDPRKPHGPDNTELVKGRNGEQCKRRLAILGNWRVMHRRVATLCQLCEKRNPGLRRMADV
jgi:hypothetical protein